MSSAAVVSSTFTFTTLWPNSTYNRLNMFCSYFPKKIGFGLPCKLFLKDTAHVLYEKAQNIRYTFLLSRLLGYNDVFNPCPSE